MTLINSSDTTDTRQTWRRWLLQLVALCVIFPAALYGAVVLIDPFSTGLFALTQRIDFANRTPRLAKAGLVRDQSFNAAMVGSSTGFPLDTEAVGDGTGWHVAHLAIVAAIPGNQLVLARAFQRHHRGTPTLMIHVLDDYWCRTVGPDEGQLFGPFPRWLYEGSRLEYLSRIFFPTAVTTAGKRLTIWLRLGHQAFRRDGYVADFFPDQRASMLAMQRPTGGASPNLPFPALDALASYVDDLPPQARLAFVMAPAFVNALPTVGSAAAIRLQACKKSVQQIAQRRPGTFYLDLLTESAFTRTITNFQDYVHVSPEGARVVAAEINRLVKESGLRP